MKKIENITTLDELLDKKYGKVGTKEREQWEYEFESFRVMALEEVEKKKR